MAITKLSLDLFFIRNLVRLTFEACHLQLGLSFHCLFCGAFLLTTTTHYHQKMDRNSNNGLSLNVRSSAEIGFFLIPPQWFSEEKLWEEHNNFTWVIYLKSVFVLQLRLLLLLAQKSWTLDRSQKQQIGHHARSIRLSCACYGSS